MGTLIISSLARGSGKTALAAGLGAHLGRKDTLNLHKVGTREDGDDRGVDDLGKLLPDSKIHQKAAALGAGLNVVEGAVGDHAANLKLAERLDGSVVAVLEPGADPKWQPEGDVKQLRSLYKDRLAGVVLNRVAPYQGAAIERARDALAAAKIELLGELPEDRTLTAPEFGAIVEHLGGEFVLGDGGSRELIKNYLIGGLVLDHGPQYFASREAVGVIVRGDRPDVQLAALQTETVRGMIVTKGINPIEYVYYEARTLGIPLAKVKHGTAEAADMVAELERGTPFDHPEKLERMAELVAANLNMELIAEIASRPATR